MQEGTEKIFAKASRSLGAARELLAEGALDLAAGRAYYAMLYAAKALLCERGLRLVAHSRIVEAFEERLAGAGAVSATHAVWLREALGRRTGEDAPTSTDVEVLVHRAGQIVDEASLLLAAGD